MQTFKYFMHVKEFLMNYLILRLVENLKLLMVSSSEKIDLSSF